MLCSEIIGKALEKNSNVKTDKQQTKKAKIENDTGDNLTLIASNVFAVLENIRTMPTEASEIDEFWTVNPAKYESKTEKNKTDDLLGDEGLLSDEDMEEETEENAGKSKKKHPLLQLLVHKRGFSECWIKFMKLPLKEEMYKKILLILHKRILPHLTEPKLLMDFLTDSYNVGGAVSLLALNGLFTLITEHNL